LWLQGYSETPFVVRKCYESWVRDNPGWQVIFLDNDNIGEYISLQTGHISRQAFSDILRINLLAKYGGVWVDATCYCVKPLDDWLPQYMRSGFFAFEKPGPDRMISSWFIAGDKSSYVVTEYQKAVNAYWNSNKKLTFFEKSGWNFLNKYFNRMGTQVWFSTFVTKVLKVYPYFWLHYLFESIYRRDKKFKEMVDAMPKVSADIPHKLQFAGLFKQLDEEIKFGINAKTAPVYKLTWKFNSPEYQPGTIMHYLLEHHQVTRPEILN